MIKPNKYLDFETGVIRISSVIIKVLMENNSMKYNEVLKNVQSLAGESAKYEFHNALGFLYLLGKVEYYNKNDVLELKL